MACPPSFGSAYEVLAPRRSSEVSKLPLRWEFVFVYAFCLRKDPRRTGHSAPYSQDGSDLVWSFEWVKTSLAKHLVLIDFRFESKATHDPVVRTPFSTASLRLLVAARNLHFCWYNFGRIHGTLRVTPAMEAGIADHIWDWEEILAWTN